MLLLGAALTPLFMAHVPMPDPSDYADHRVVRVQIDDPAHVHALLDGGMDCLACTPGPGAHPWVVDDLDLATIESLGLTWTPLVDDLAAHMATRNEQRRAARNVRGGSYYDDYRTLDEAMAHLDGLAATYPDLVTSITIGQSHEGRDIRGIVIRAGEDNGRPAVLFNGCQHAREWISPMTVMYIGEQLLEGHGTDGQITNLLQKLEVVVIPIVNPDGYAHTYAPDGYRFWRKNRRDNDGTCEGVDLNRNWGADWNGGQSTSEDPCSDVYVGPASMSEPEVQALADYCINHGNIVAQIDYHAFSELILEPRGYSPEPPPDYEFLHGLGLSMRDAIASLYGRSYATDTPCNILYCASGTLIDWPYEELGSAAYCIELRPSSGGTDGFDPPPSEIRPCAEENFLGALALLDSFGGSLALTLPDGAPTVVRTDQSTSFLVQITAINETVATAELRWTDGGGSWQSVPLVQETDELWLATLPAFVCDASPAYFVEVISNSETVITIPTEGENTPFTASPISKIEVIWEDQGEADDGWVSQGDMTDGQWDRGVPVGGGERGDPPTDADGSGACWLTDNVAGNSDVDGGTAQLIAPGVQINGTDQVLTYTRWFSNDFGAAPGEDRFIVEWSNDLAMPWQPLEVVGPSGDGTSGGWITVEHDIDSLEGLSDGDMIWLRFSAEDLGNGSVVEAGVDALRIDRQVCEDDTPSCDGDLDGDGIVGVDDVLAVLSAFGGSDASGDANGDGQVNVDDILLVVGAWGDC